MDYTPAQIGRVSDVAAHGANALPPGVDPERDDTPESVNYAPREARSWRLTPRLASAAGPATDGQQGGYVAPHTTAGSPDPRAQWGGTAGATGPTESLRPSPESLANTREYEAVNAQAPIDRPRAGSIGTDPARPAWMPRWLFWRPFDAWAAYGVPAVDKIPSASPVASQPLTYADPLHDAYPTAGGSTAEGRMEGIGPQPNTVRWLPGQWDAAVTQTNVDNGTGYNARAASRSWRLG
jgi:hypothetical protein